MVYGSIGGLISGMDTASIVGQLMQLEALPQSGLKSRVSTQERQVNALQTLNAKLSSIATKAAELTRAAQWASVKATSTSDQVTAKASAGAQPTAINLTVTRVAGTHQVSYSNAVKLDHVIAPSGAITVDPLDGTAPTSLDVGDGSLGSVVKAVNAAGLGVEASAVKADPVDIDGDGTLDEVYRLRLVSTATGATSDFSVGGLDSTVLGTQATTAGQDAKITVGSGAAAVPTSSATNTFIGLAPGVDVTLASSTPPGTEVTVTVKPDTQALGDKVKAMVDATNLALTEIKSLSSYDPATKKGGLLVGDSMLRTLRNDLLASVASGVDGTSLAAVGIALDKTGRLTFDKAVFEKAYAADPTGTAGAFTGKMTFADDGTSTGSPQLDRASWRTQPGTYTVSATSIGGTIDGAPATLAGSLLSGATGTRVEGLTLSYNGDVSGTVTYTQGFAARVEALAQRASHATEGNLSHAVKSRNSTIGRLNDDIADWNVRLDLRRTTLERQFSALEVALGSLQNQGNWLAGQLAGLPKWSS